MAVRLADVIEEFTRKYNDEHTTVTYRDEVDDRKFSEALEKHLRENFVILPQKLRGQK